MSFVTFVRDYAQDPDRIIHIPNFIFDLCKEFFWYIFSFQWFRNLTYVTLYKPSPEQSSSQIENLLNKDSWLSTYFELPADQLSFFHNSLYGLFNGFSSTFHFCAVTILIIHVLLNENKNRAFKIALASCFGDFSCMVAVLFGFRELIVSWLTLEPLTYVLGFAIQFFFALEIIKDNRRIKANFDRRSTRRMQIRALNDGQLSLNRWLIPALILFSWCEQTQFFQTGNVFSLQPTATFLEIPGLSKELQTSVYLLTFIVTRIIVTWFCLSIFQNLVNWRDNNKTTPMRWSSYNLLISSNRQEFIAYIKNNFLRIYNDLNNLVYNVKSWFIPKSLGTEIKNNQIDGPSSKYAKQSSQSKFSIQSDQLYITENQTKHFLRDPLAIAAVTCSLAFLPAYSTNLLVTKSIGFFPEENRTKHSLFSPWDMPSKIFANDIDYITNHPSIAEYPFFLPFYDKGDYGGWLGVSEEDIRYGPLRLWKNRRTHAPWRQTTLGEPRATFANDKSLFTDPLHPRPDLKSSSGFSDSKNQDSYGKDSKGSNQQQTANIKAGISISPMISDPLNHSNQEAQQLGYESPILTEYPSPKWKYLWKQLKTKTAYRKYLLLFPEKINEIQSQQAVSTNSNNSKITKAGRKKLIALLKEPLRQQYLSYKEPYPYISHLKENLPSEKHKTSFLPSYLEAQIINDKPIIKRSKESKRSRLFKTRLKLPPMIVGVRNIKSYPINRLKHFSYIKNKIEKRRKSGRLIHRLRRQYPYIRNIRQRKADLFGFYLPMNNISSKAQRSFSENRKNYNSLDFKEKAIYSGEYPNKKDSINVKKDFNLIFRTQIGEGLDFAQEEIRAKIFKNPYVHFLLNSRIDKLSSRSTEISSPKHALINTKNSSDSLDAKQQRERQSKDSKENNLFKRRLLISKYADAVDFLKPSYSHSYVDRVYNHQFKGTLSTARRLFSLKVQYDQPLVHPLNYKSAIEHEGLSSPSFLESHKSNESSESYKFKGLQQEQPNLLEKTYSAPLYASWDSNLRKLVLANRYLNYKTVTSVAKPVSQSQSNSPEGSLQDKVALLSLDPKGESDPEHLTSDLDQKSVNNLIQFTSWPLKEPYFKDNEFLVSQLYSNSQPIDSLLSQENEKARPVALPRRVDSFNEVLYSKNNVQATDAQRSQQFLKLQSNDKKTFLFKHFWNLSSTSSGLISQPRLNLRTNKDLGSKNSFTASVDIPMSAEQRKASRVEERDYPLWMVLRALPPNQGGFLWPGD